MKRRDADLDRLLRAAAATESDAAPAEMPFGFATRVVALAGENGTRANGSAELTRFVRRIGALAVAVLAIASAGAYQQFATEADATGGETPLGEAYAIADNAIQSEIPELVL